MYACGGRSREQSPAINRKLCMQAKAGAESLPGRGEGVGMDMSCPCEMLRSLHETLKIPIHYLSIGQSLFMWEARH